MQRVGATNEGLYNIGQLEEFATALAVGYEVYTGPLLSSKRLSGLEECTHQLNWFLVKCAKLKAGQDEVDRQSMLNRPARPVISNSDSAVDANHHERSVPSAVTWLIDNLAIVGECVEAAGKGLPKCDYGRLPEIKGGRFAGFPRIYRMAVCLTFHLGNRLDTGSLKRFLLAYQQVAPLTITELWSFATTLWLVLTENLQHIITQIVATHEESDKAPLLINEDRVDFQMKLENILASMRSLSAINWPAFFESISPVDRILCKDPAGTFLLMEFATRDYYRQIIGRIAKRTNMAERDVAQCAVDLALESHSTYPTDKYLAHVGYYLLDAGRTKLDGKIGYRLCWRERLSRVVWRRLTGFCLGALTLLTSLALSLFLLYAFHAGASALAYILLPVLLVIPASELALNFLVSLLLSKPCMLPKMDFANGIPAESQTMVVVPAILSSEAVVRELLESIEACYLANQDDHIFFALLGDWSDAPQEKMPNDGVLLDRVMNGIKNLNERYSMGSRDRFYLFHRRRQWNHGEQKWMGWERKRGKIREFNWLMRGARDTSYIVCTADQDFLTQTRYVITLDSDTLMLRDAARRLIATISHPLNRPKIDASSGRLLRGYAIIQPQLNPPPPRASRSQIPMILSNYLQVNLQTVAPMNLYQDLFGESLYVGKGIYDIDAFECMLKDRIPDNSLLSHDMYEGLYARTALAADIVVFEGYPLHYCGVKRVLHRWVRGDWQLLPWLMPHVQDAHGKLVHNELPALSRWKLFDLLRRSLFMPTTFLCLIAAWVILPGSPVTWTAIIALTSSLSAWFPVVKTEFLTRQHETLRNNFYRNVRDLAKFSIAQIWQLIISSSVFILLLADQAYFRADGITRSIYRLFVSRKHLLDWVTAAQSQEELGYGLRTYITLMWQPVIIALIVGGLIFAISPATFTPAAPILIAWFISPLAVYWMERKHRKLYTTYEQYCESAIRLNGRRIWRDIECLSNNSDNLRLSSGIYRENLKGGIADTTVNTNSLRHLLWLVAAYDLGCIGTVELAERLDYALAMVMKHRGSGSCHHGDNDIWWLELPAAQSIVAHENGNPAVYFTSLKNIIRGIAERPLFDQRVLNGFTDTTSLMKEEMAQFHAEPQVRYEKTYQQLHDEIEQLAAIMLQQKQAVVSQDLSGWHSLLNLLTQHVTIVDGRLKMLSHEIGIGNRKLRYWTDSLIHQTREFKRDLSILAPWTPAGTASLVAAFDDSDANARGGLNHITALFDQVPSVSYAPELSRQIFDKLVTLRQTSGRLDMPDKYDVLVDTVKGTIEASQKLLLKFANLAERSELIGDFKSLHPLFDAEYKVMWANFQFSSQTKLADTVVNRTYAMATRES
jgi:hypothetical protein